MVDFVPVLLLAFGLVSVLKPEWIAAVHRRQKAAGTKNRAGDIAVSDTWIIVTRTGGLLFVIFGLLFTIQSL